MSPIRGRSSNTSTVPSTSPRMPATPDVGWICAAATWSSVVLPAPLGPRTTQRSSSSTVQSTASSRVACPAPDGDARRTPGRRAWRHPIQHAVSAAVRRILARRDDASARAGRLAWWGTAWLRGHVVTDQCSTPCSDATLTHARATGATARPARAAGRLRAPGATGVGLALPAEGDPLGLGGPPAFNAAALEAGEAVVVAERRPRPGARRGRGRRSTWRRRPAAAAAGARHRRGRPRAAAALTTTARPRWPTSTWRGGDPRSPTS